jgi:putative spermidine/putrescine transport system ATP-binding protein
MPARGHHRQGICGKAGDADDAQWCARSVKRKRGRSLDEGGESVDIRSVSKTYDAVRVLDSVTLNVAPREFVSLLGPSGSGKTTLLGILGGFIQPSSGAIHFGGRDVTFVPPHKRDIGVVFQNYALFPHMSVGENVAFPLRARRLPKASWPEKIRATLAMVGLAGYEQRRISQLSGGQRQRVALARAMIFEPRLILMDEPLSALDKQLREAMQIELRELHRRIGATIIYVTHDQREALTMSDRVAILKDGRLVQIDRPERLHDHPADSFVASFIGEASLLPVRRIDAGSVALGAMVLRSARAVPAAETPMLVVHSEKLLIDDGEANAACNRLTGMVTDVVYQGESLRIFLKLADGSGLSLRQPSHYAASRRIPPIGGELTVTLHPEDTIVVPKARE